MTIKMRDNKENENQALPTNKIKEASSVLDTWLVNTTRKNIKIAKV